MKTVISFVLLLAACSSVPKAPSDLPGKLFPRVQGTSLSGEKIRLPDSYAGGATILLIGYLQKAQFDIDRWILGIVQAEVSAKVVEIPTVQGLLPGVAQSYIDEGMRGGIPKEDWASVVTVYEDANKIVNFLGNERPHNAHVVLLDTKGAVQWTADRGYSAGQILELKKIVQALR